MRTRTGSVREPFFRLQSSMFNLIYGVATKPSRTVRTQSKHHKTSTLLNVADQILTVFKDDISKT
jgi:hypothetical protein